MNYEHTRCLWMFPFIDSGKKQLLSISTLLLFSTWQIIDYVWLQYIFSYSLLHIVGMWLCSPAKSAHLHISCILTFILESCYSKHVCSGLDRSLRMRGSRPNLWSGGGALSMSSLFDPVPVLTIAHKMVLEACCIFVFTFFYKHVWKHSKHRKTMVQRVPTYL